MKAATYVSAGNLQLIDQPKPAFKKPTDAIASLVKTTICGTDLHILGGLFQLVKKERFSVTKELGLSKKSVMRLRTLRWEIRLSSLV